MTPALHGPQLTKTGVSLRLWAPAARKIEAIVQGHAHVMIRTADRPGWFIVDLPGTSAGLTYRFRVDDGDDVPDPASAFQPEDISGPSEVIDHAAFRWQAKNWRGRPWHEAVFLECHVGAFTPEGTYRAMIERLDDLVGTGITAIELMPLADFPGARNWGYDGVLWYAPDHTYGTPDDLRTLVDQAHLRGLMVFLDVVYNHFGPEGNYLARYAPSFFNDAETPWGRAIDYTVPEVRAFAIDNALHWLQNYRFDGLRLDAVHALHEPGGLAMLGELSQAVARLAAETRRHIHLVLENDDNRASLIRPAEPASAAPFSAQWNDDYHHAWHVLLTGETHGYYIDYARSPERLIARMLKSGFAYQGEASAHRGGQSRGEPTKGVPPAAFVTFLQNHDQVGNRALGDRLEWSADPKAIEAALAITLLSPMPPLLFMGEEFGARTPFPFFCDFHGELADAIRRGRRIEFAEAYDAYGNEVPDPLADSTFQSAKLHWHQRDATQRERHALVTALLAVRRTEIIPRVKEASFGEGDIQPDRTLHAEWRLANGEALTLLANISPRLATRIHLPIRGRPIWGGHPPERLPPWSAFWVIGGQ